MKANLLKKKIADGVNCVGGWAAIPIRSRARCTRHRVGTA